MCMCCFVYLATCFCFIALAIVLKKKKRTVVYGGTHTLTQFSLLKQRDDDVSKCTEAEENEDI